MPISAAFLTAPTTAPTVADAGDASIITLPDGSTQLRDTVSFVKPDGSVEYPDGSVRLQSGELRLASGEIVPAVTVTVPPGAVALADGTVKLANGDVILPSGNVLRSDGQVVDSATGSVTPPTFVQPTQGAELAGWPAFGPLLFCSSLNLPDLEYS